MMSKVDKVEKVTGVQMDANSPWLQRRNRDDQESENSFREMLKNSVVKRAQKGVVTPISEAAVWEGNGVTQSLFYEKGVDLDFFYRQRMGGLF